MNQNIITNLSDKELKIIQLLDESGNMSVLELAKATGIKRTTIYNFIDQLVDSGLISMQIVNGARRYYPVNKELSLLQASPTGNGCKTQNLQLLLSTQAIKNEIKKNLKVGDTTWFLGSKKTANAIGLSFIEKCLESARNSKYKIKIIVSFEDSSYIEKLSRFPAHLEKYSKELDISTSFIFGTNTIIVSADKNGVGYTLKDKELSKTLYTLLISP
ncbi:MAG: Sugar-specific transcriptional regulator TrmB [bacterium ADurb.Bin212]|nr:MAG: Sugar-specific transcriptional regulator TrmB [bacterium ADurb.Bin212]